MTLSDEERKVKRKAYDAKPEVKGKRKAYQQSHESKVKRKEHDARPEVKVKKKAYDAKPEAKVNRKAYQQRPESKARQKEIRDDLKMDIFSYYSKIQSNSDIPCCRCCGLTSHIEFLSLDHIAGRKKMDSELELVKLGYSSKMKSTSLLKWIKKNNFPNTFQILCHNCNFAKGHSKDNKCPHERN